MKIAFLGSRGIPARYSGFETFYEQLSTRLVQRGHEVTVYNRSHFIKDVKHEYKGVKIISLPSIPSKHLDTITHTFISTLFALFHSYDIVYYSIVGNSPLVWMPRMLGMISVLNVDGEDWAREKWGAFARRYQLWCEKIACKTSDLIISDAHGVRQRYLERYRQDSVFVPYGANIQKTESKNVLLKWKLKPEEYILYVGRFVPENGIDVLIRAFRNLKTNKKLVLIGDAPYVTQYKKYLYDLSDNDPYIIFTGYAFGQDYSELSSHAYVSIQPSGVEGTRPALLDQMGFGNCVIVRDTSVNQEVVNEYGLFFEDHRPVESLTEVLRTALNHPELVKKYRKRVVERIRSYYNWELITEFYEDLFYRLKKNKSMISYDEFLEERSLCS